MFSSVKTARVVYWAFTLLVTLPMVLAGIAYVSRADQMVQGIAHLGYPVYFLTILGTAKLLGVAAILYGRIAVLKEWAYAGFTFDFLGAFCSHLFSGDPLATAMIPFIFFVMLMASYVSGRELKRLTAAAAEGGREMKLAA